MFRIGWRPTWPAGIVLGLVLIVIQGASAAERLAIGGTGGDLGTMERLGIAFAAANPDVSVEVLSSLGSGGGIKALLAGRIDLAISSRPAREAAAAQGAVSVPYARTAVALATSRPVDPGFTAADVAAAYRGERATWPDGTPIRLVLRPATDTDTKIVGASMPGMSAALEAAAALAIIPVGASDQDAATLLESTAGSLGFISLSLVRSEGRALTVLTLDGVAPGPDSIADGSYPVPKTFYFVHRNEPAAAVSRFLGFVASEEGRLILRSLGHVPLIGGDG